MSLSSFSLAMKSSNISIPCLMVSYFKLTVNYNANTDCWLGRDMVFLCRYPVMDSQRKYLFYWSRLTSHIQFMAINTEDNRNGQEILLVRRVSCLYDETRWIKFSDELRLSSLHKTMQRWYTIYSLCPLLEDFVQVLVIILRAFRLLLRYRAHSYKKKNS